MNELPPDRLHLWIVEDASALRESLTRNLATRRPAWMVRGFPMCEPALAVPLDQGPEVVLMDLGLPGMSGLDGIRALRERWPAAEIVVFTVFDDAERIYAAICAGASGYLLKSEPIDTVVAAVEEVRRGGSPMLPQVARKVMDRLNGRQRANPETVLSDRERAVLQAMSEGLSKKEVAMRLELSAHTVDNYLRRIYAKLHVNTMQGAVGKALKDRLL
jgi:DNA-binding NarL/FixJ family response regulator